MEFRSAVRNIFSILVLALSFSCGIGTFYARMQMPHPPRRLAQPANVNQEEPIGASVRVEDAASSRPISADPCLPAPRPPNTDPAFRAKLAPVGRVRRSRAPPSLA